MHPKAHTFVPFDQLPAELRHEINFAACTWDSAVVLSAYRPAAQQRGPDWAIGWLTASIRAGDEEDSVNFGRRYRLRYGHDWPAQAAGATILRYQPPFGTRQAQLRRGAEPRVRAAWAASSRLLPA